MWVRAGFLGNLKDILLESDGTCRETLRNFNLTHFK